ncbi:MAG TPA: sel1 repeat family protein, partial [Chromatiales bacterium]|nr:sel1 repeat family protein [Chromatiales bacterium]
MKISHLTKALCISGALLFAGSGAMADPYKEGYDSAYGGNYGEAFSKWYPLAMEGDARAQFSLGLMYHSGLFVEMDESKALFWYHKAAENGIREAQE